MLGAIIGDIVGSIYEWNNVKSKDFPLFTERSSFTDVSVLTCAIANAIICGTEYRENLIQFARLFPGRGYGSGFSRWVGGAYDGYPEYQSCGNGSAMRVSPVGWAFNSVEKVLTVLAAPVGAYNNMRIWPLRMRSYSFLISSC